MQGAHKIPVIAVFGEPTIDRVYHHPWSGKGELLDRIIEHHHLPGSHEEHQRYVGLLGHYEPGGKFSPSRDVYLFYKNLGDQLGLCRHVGPGGTGANIARNMNAVARGHVQPLFVGAFFADAEGQEIDEILRAEGIKVIANWNTGETPVNLVKLLATDDRRILKKSGAAGLYPEPATALAEADCVLILGQMAEKNPELLEKTAQICRAQGKAVIYTLPTDPAYTAAHRQEIISLVQLADVVLGNASELGWVAGDCNIAVSHPWLQEQMRQKPEGRKILFGEKVAFITNGAAGAHVLTAQENTHIPTLKDVTIKNTAGAGDAAFGGFLGGCFRSLPFPEAARLGTLSAVCTIADYASCVANLGEKIEQHS